MFKSKFPILALLLVTALSTRFDDIVWWNRQIVSSLWANGVSLNINGRQNTLEMIASDVTPVVWSGDFTIAASVYRGAGKALMMPRILIDRLFNTTPCDAFCQQWRNVLFNTTTVTVEEATAFFARQPSARSNRTIILVRDTSTGFESGQLLRDWEAGVVGPLVLQHSAMSVDGPNNKLSEMAFQMGIFFSSSTVVVPSALTGLSYEPVQKAMPYGLTLQAWTDNSTTLDIYPPRFFPFGDNTYSKLTAKFPLYGEDVYRFVQKYDKMLQDNQVSRSKPIRNGGTNQPYDIDFFITYVRQTYSQALEFISQDRLDKLTFNYGSAGGLVDNATLPDPVLGQYTVTLNCRSDIYIPLGLDQMPHTLIQYEIVNQTNARMEIGVGAFFDSLNNKDTLLRVADGRSSEVMERNGTFYSPIGGPIVIRPGTFRGQLVIRLRNVYRSPGFDLRDQTRSSFIWDSGTFTNTKARFATIVCDVIFFTVEYSVVRGYSSQNLKDICKSHDHIVKSYDNYIGTSAALTRERFHIVFDVQPKYGLAHAGQPIVCPQSWGTSLLSMANSYVNQTKDSGYWGLLHEIGHMFQPGYWKFGVFGETTNNVLVLMFQDRYLGLPLSMQKAHANMYRMNNIFDFINIDDSGYDRVWTGLHFHYHLIPSFGWGLYGNVLNRYINETSSDLSFDRFTRYLSEETGYNLAPYTHYFRMSDLAKNITAVYQEYSHLPTYKPSDYILNSTLARWEKTREFFGFTNDVQVNQTLPFKFTPNLNFDSISLPSPIVDVL